MYRLFNDAVLAISGFQILLDHIENIYKAAGYSSYTPIKLLNRRRKREIEAEDDHGVRFKKRVKRSLPTELGTLFTDEAVADTHILYNNTDNSFIDRFLNLPFSVRVNLTTTLDEFLVYCRFLGQPCNYSTE
jgi:hypothetical protein